MDMTEKHVWSANKLGQMSPPEFMKYPFPVDLTSTSRFIVRESRGTPFFNVIDTHRTKELPEGHQSVIISYVDLEAAQSVATVCNLMHQEQK